MFDLTRVTTPAAQTDGESRRSAIGWGQTAPRIASLMLVMHMVAPETAGAQVHPLVYGNEPAGHVARTLSAARGYPVAGYVQPVQFNGPDGVRFALPVQETFGPGQSDLWAGLPVGGVYRFRITGIPGREGAELYPTIEMIDRTYPPPHLRLKFPIRVDIDQDDLLAALDGELVTRVIYLEDNQNASPLPQTDVPDRPLDIAAGDDPLLAADSLGRPLAIVRMGSMTPPRSPALMASFFHGSPTYFPIYRTSMDPIPGVTP